MMADRSKDLAGAEAAARAEAEAQAVAHDPTERAQEPDALERVGGSVDTVRARNVTITRGGAGRVEATDVAVSQGGIGAARADRVFVELGGLGAAMGGEINVTQGYLGPTIAREVHLEQAFARSVVAGNASFGPRSGAFLVIAGRVEGSLRPVLDWRGGLALGAGFGLVTGLIRARRAMR
jgi:hypothetical protein